MKLFYSFNPAGLFTLRWATLRYRPERSILELYDDVRGSLRNWRHCKQSSELAAMLVYRRIWRIYMEFIWSFGAFSSQFAVGIVNYARTTLIYGYFIAITFAGTFERYLNSFHGTRQMFMHEKPWVIPVLFQHCAPAGWAYMKMPYIPYSTQTIVMTDYAKKIK